MRWRIRPTYNRHRHHNVPWQLLAVPVVCTAALGSAVYLKYRDEVPYTKRSRLLLLSKASEWQLGTSAFRSFQRQHQHQLLSTQHPQHQMITRICRALMSHSPLSLPWEVIVLHDDETVNAFVLPGGKMVVYSGIFKVLNNVDGLAAIIGHEMGHAIARHAAETMTTQSLLNSFLLLFLPIDYMSLAQMVMQVGIELPFSRKFELEADTIGLHLMTQACFDPRESPKVFSRLKALGGNDKTFKYLSTHPPCQERIAKLQQEMPKALETFQKQDCFLKRRAYSRREA